MNQHFQYIGELHMFIFPDFVPIIFMFV